MHAFPDSRLRPPPPLLPLHQWNIMIADCTFSIPVWYLWVSGVCIYKYISIHVKQNKTKSLNLIILFPFSQLFSRFPLILDKIQIPFLTYKAQHNLAPAYLSCLNFLHISPSPTHTSHTGFLSWVRTVCFSTGRYLFMFFLSATFSSYTLLPPLFLVTLPHPLLFLLPLLQILV